MTKNEILANCGRHDPQVLAHPNETPTCRRWLGPRTIAGAAILHRDRKTLCVSRLMMRAVLGRELQPDEVVRHVCGYATCVNPDHLTIADASKCRVRLTASPPSRNPVPSLRVAAVLKTRPALTGRALFDAAAPRTELRAIPAP